MIADEIAGSLEDFSGGVFSQTDVERAVFPVVKLLGQLQAVGLMLGLDVFLPFGQGVFELGQLVGEERGLSGLGDRLFYYVAAEKLHDTL